MYFCLMYSPQKIDAQGFLRRDQTHGTHYTMSSMKTLHLPPKLLFHALFTWAHRFLFGNVL